MTTNIIDPEISNTPLLSTRMILSAVEFERNSTAFCLEVNFTKHCSDSDMSLIGKYLVFPLSQQVTICGSYISYSLSHILSAEFDHIDFICKERWLEITCDHYLASKLTIRDLSVDNYIILLREPIRELLLLPHPNRIKANYNHFDNEGLVQRSEFCQINYNS